MDSATVMSPSSRGTPGAIRPLMRSWLAIAFAVLTAGCSGTIDDGIGGETPDSPDSPDNPPQPVDITGPDVLPHVQAFADATCGATGACSISTYVGHSPTAERAVDILTSDVYGEVPTDNNALGDEVAQWALDHMADYAIDYVIWRQRIHTGDDRGWRDMEDRGSITQNHYDHVHVSFAASL